ncbi:hypothetical protein [uncultured Mailhella sp.]|uniref:hypothetical protein n=1 Tax=uncultured Mailhella sp. TaxID=1981031 RepID=UPI0025CBF96D|nr:hypothetical protein [uncultured Mailhella sp.]
MISPVFVGLYTNTESIKKYGVKRKLCGLIHIKTLTGQGLILLNGKRCTGEAFPENAFA